MKWALLIIFMLALLITSCDSAPENQYIYHSPENIEDGIEVSALDEANIDPDLIGTAVDKIREGNFKEVHSMLIFRDNKLVFEKYFPGHRYKWDGPGNHG